MNNKVLWGVGALVIVGVAAYLLMSNKPATDTENDSTQNNQPQTASQKKSLRDLMASGSQKCVYTDGQSSGTVYVANGKTRMDITTVANGANTGSHAIIDNETYYTWVDGQTSGFKFSIKGSAQGSAESDQS